MKDTIEREIKATQWWIKKLNKMGIKTQTFNEFMPYWRKGYDDNHELRKG